MTKQYWRLRELSLAEARKVRRIAIREIKAQRWCDFVSDLDANPWGFPQDGDA